MTKMTGSPTPGLANTTTGNINRTSTVTSTYYEGGDVFNEIWGGNIGGRGNTNVIVQSANFNGTGLRDIQEARHRRSLLRPPPCETAPDPEARKYGHGRVSGGDGGDGEYYRKTAAVQVIRDGKVVGNVGGRGNTNIIVQSESDSDIIQYHQYPNGRYAPKPPAHRDEISATLDAFEDQLKTNPWISKDDLEMMLAQTMSIKEAYEKGIERCHGVSERLNERISKHKKTN